jgi:hypothetical protein
VSVPHVSGLPCEHFKRTYFLRIQGRSDKKREEIWCVVEKFFSLTKPTDGFRVAVFIGGSSQFERYTGICHSFTSMLIAG